MAGEIRVGTSGWQYDDWRGTVYPKGVGTGRWLSQYVQWFPTVEVNSTFYRLAKASAARGWRQTAPPGFEFALKGSQFITHRLKLKDPGRPIQRFFEPLQPVLDRTAVVLWQLPPGWHRNVERLDTFLAALPVGIRYAVEFRDDDWFHPDAYAVLDRHRAAHVWLSSSLTSGHELVRTGDLLYVRFHGLGESPYRWDYSHAELELWAERLRDATADGTPAWVYFNNDYEGHAVRNARTLIEMLGDTARPWPLMPTEDIVGGDGAPLPPGGHPQPPERLTAFQHAVVAVVSDLHAGQILTYDEVAIEAGHPGAAQAVANVLRRVPGLPWWRVVPQGGRLYRTHAPTQRPLLEAEGVEVDDDRRLR